MSSRVMMFMRRAAINQTASTQRLGRQFHKSAMRRVENPLPTRKPVGAFRGGLFGFLFGSTLAGGLVYYYVLEEYKVSNELLTEDILKLQSTVQDVHGYVQTLEEKINGMKK